LHSLIKPGSVVFFDPDNGLEIKSVARGRKNSEKYVYLNELEAVWHRGCSLLVYQHFPRVNRDLFLEQQAAVLEAALSEAQVVPILTSHVAFLMIAQPQARAEFGQIHAEVIKRWWPYTKAAANQSAPSEGPQLYLSFDREACD
jgi:hypothetical protein